MALIALFITDVVIVAEGLPMSVYLIESILKLLVAWMLIRTVLQFIANRFVRNIFAFSIWAIAALSILGILDETTYALDAVGLTIGDFRLSPLVVIKAAPPAFLNAASLKFPALPVHHKS